MDRTVIIHPQEKPNDWRLMSALLFVSFFVIGLAAMTLLNGGVVNHMLFPVGADIAMFQLIWQGQPLSALEFIVTKSLFVFAYQDPRSGLNLWTLQYDSITLLVYLLAALSGGQLVRRIRHHKTGLLRGLLGVVLLVAAFTYMTAIEHCSGATWVGFVGFYGLGFSDFEFYPYYQGVLTLSGLGLLIWGFVKQTQANR